MPTANNTDFIQPMALTGAKSRYGDGDGYGYGNGYGNGNGDGDGDGDGYGGIL